MNGDAVNPPDLDVDDAAAADLDEALPGKKGPKLLDPAVSALLDDVPEAAAQRAFDANQQWRVATEREAPSLERIATSGTLARVDADVVSGYIAVATGEETHRAFVDRAWLPTIVALLVRRPRMEMESALADGPVSLTPTERATPS